MAPEYGATCGFFAIDYETLKYLRLTGREEHNVKVVEEYAKLQGMWRDAHEPEYTDMLELDMSTLSPSLAGPKRPQDRVNLSDMQQNFIDSLEDLAGAGADLSVKHQIADTEKFNRSWRFSYSSNY